MMTTARRRYILAAVCLAASILAAGQVYQTPGTVAGSLVSLIATAVVYVTAARAEAAENGTTRRPSADECTDRPPITPGGHPHPLQP